MQVLSILDHLSSGGAQRQMVILMVGLAQRGHKVDCFVYHTHDFYRDELIKHGIRLLEFPKSTKYTTRTIRELRRTINEGEYDIVVSFLTTPNIYAILAMTLVTKRPALVVSERSSPSNPNYNWRARLAEKAYRFADAVTVNSHHLRTYFEERHTWAAGNVITIWNGVDTQKFQMISMPPRSSKFRILAVGQLARFKQARCLVEALAIVRDQHHVTASVDWIARRFPNLMPREVAYKSELDERLRYLGLTDQWTWHAERPDVEAAIHQCDCLVHGSTVEGLPNAVCEALACGRPVLASNTLDHPRLVQDGVSGLLFEPQNPECLAGAIHQLASYPDSRLKAMGQAAHAFSRRELSPSKYVDQYESLFHRLLDSKASQYSQ